jgi:hypothetical protein
MKRLLKSIMGGDAPRHIATIRHGRTERIISAHTYVPSSNTRLRSSVAEAKDAPMQHQTYAIKPLLDLAGVETFTVKWPTRADTVAIAAHVEGSESDARLWAALLWHLCGIPMPVSNRLALAHGDALAAMFAYAFREMRAQMPAGDPRLAEWLPAVLAREVA